VVGLTGVCSRGGQLPPLEINYRRGAHLMSLKKFGAALIAVLALGAVMASSAFALPTTPVGTQLYVNGVKKAAGASESLVCSAGTPLILKGTVAGAATEIKAKKLTCAGAKLNQVGTGGMVEAVGKLVFSELEVLKPAGCKTAASIETAELKARIFTEGALTTYVRFAPKAETTETEQFAVVPLTECAAEGKYPAKGVVFGKANNTGVEVTPQPVVFSEANQKAGGGKLTLGTNEAQISGEGLNALESGLKFKTEAK
jgi:hypothetical protein